VNVAPKKPNWDLRRDVEKKLAKLERRTQRALIQIMQAEQAAKLQAEGGIQD
jgi:coiled-coil domain-containing protein 12